MKLVKRPRTSRSKLQKALTAQGGEFYFSKKPSSKKADHVGGGAKVTKAKAEGVGAKK